MIPFHGTVKMRIYWKKKPILLVYVMRSLNGLSSGSDEEASYKRWPLPIPCRKARLFQCKNLLKKQKNILTQSKNFKT